MQFLDNECGDTRNVGKIDKMDLSKTFSYSLTIGIKFSLI